MLPGARCCRALTCPPRVRAAGTQHRHAGARNSFRPLPRAAGGARALDRDVALSPTRVQKDQVVAKVGPHCAARGGGRGLHRVACGSRACALRPRGRGRHRMRAQAVVRRLHARCTLRPAQDPPTGGPRHGRGTRSVDSAGLLVEDHAVEFHHLCRAEYEMG